MENVRQCSDESECKLEHLIIDGGSSDGTSEVVRNYAASHPHIIPISQAGVTKARAGNEALNQASHDLIGWLEVNERYNPGTFKLVTKLFSEGNIEFLIGSHSKITDDGEILYGQNSHFSDQTDLVEYWKTWGSEIILPWHSTFYRREVHEELGLYNERTNCFGYEFLLRASETHSLFCVAERFTSFHIDEKLSSKDRARDYLIASQTYWGKLGHKSQLRYSLSSTFHLKFPSFASICSSTLELSQKVFLKTISITKQKIAENFNRKFFSRALDTPPIEVNPESQVEIHSLSGNRDLYMLLLGLKSFLRFYNDVRVVIHDDGSLGDKGKNQLRHHIPGVEVFSAKSDPDEFDELAIEDFNVYKAKGIINHCKGKKIIMLDSDMLFINEPSEILEWIKSDEKIRRYGVDHYEHHSKYIEIKRASEQKNLAPCFNAGLICLYAEDIEKEDFISLIKRVHNFDSVFFAEQVAFCFIVSRYPHRSLPKERYVPCYFPDPESSKEIITEETAHLHFMGDKSHKVHDLYKYYANQVHEDLVNSERYIESDIPKMKTIISDPLQVPERF